MNPLDGTDGTVFTENGHLYTLSLSPGSRVYGERLVRTDGLEFREWNPNRSKLAAYLKNGGRAFPIKKDSRVLYLGASSGTTASHVSDIVSDGRVYCVEFAPRMFRDLVGTCALRPNMIPILGDALNPSEYGFAIGGVDVIYSDVAQKRHAGIVSDNADAFGVDKGMMAVKARSEDTTAEPREVFRMTEERLRGRGFAIAETKNLEPYENAHEMIVFER
ncbi:MAG: fibrillarin-like rRNA/tRNA 2'-O-methyltransferase [Candidatus Methanoplasma sp.]|jgi:fibrillarin-like pre-rRNA processing protein|nr:fibrillarin-like rRNA/tRNA 2'-O-methyltransferase [Candidatus Methanoplasma sp.]